MKPDLGQVAMMVTIAVHVLGLAGMAGVWLVPSRLLSIIIKHRIGVPLARNWPSVAATLVVLTAILFSAYIAVDALPRVFRCLWEQRCTATRGGALLALAMFGGSVVFTELTWYGSAALLRRWGTAQP